MDTKLIRKALADAYDLLYQERESVCLDWLSEVRSGIKYSDACNGRSR